MSVRETGGFVLLGHNLTKIFQTDMNGIEIDTR